ncbi:FKBP-type peptidyl-prolyl cis-trans isomerase [Planctomyces sp. SH-PL14]|jgi:FKBP-type peptidyl-prolyl cis-trans isomerase|uniref:FKBP-type peptidyl-prolyl cis-trans isomerase n=1 Tax=Planctomyces sp. SH-PL14 TaxID=1632864 RepID=UPI00078C78F8|nr:FKBP-type peptidyl-prolyl cis-trans isomerase [Planctomyces sp. SH-PL14]AMV19874.1 putative FKBP-type peptidyl-prolyl cis-trans isomerase [Planctomyces sp. SH-PL14]
MVMRLSWAACLSLALCQGCAEPPAPPASAPPAPPAAAATDSGPREVKLPEGAGKADENAPKTLTAQPSGLKYRILREGKGAKPTASDTVEVNYHGWLDNGNVFDSSYARKESISFPLGGVIPGWTEGMQLVGEGGMIELEIPPELGYGAQGAGRDVPPNATLHFIVELIDVK